MFPPVSPVLRGLWQEASREFEVNLEHTMKSQLRKMGFQDSINGVLCGDLFSLGKEEHLEALLSTEITGFPYSTVGFLVNGDKLSKTVVSKV